MLRLAAYLALFAGLTYSGLWLADHPAEVVIHWQGYEITMQFGILVAMAFLGFVILITGFLLLRSLLLTPSRIRKQQNMRRHEYAIDALNHTMTALALNDYREAERQLNKSRHYLKNDPPVTRLLGVQLAHATGKEANARAAFDAMLEDASTRPVALRGKIRDLMQKNEWVHARDFAEEAFNDRPSDHWVAMVLLDILFREQDWSAIERTLLTGQRKNSLSREQARHYTAMLHLARAEQTAKGEQWPQAELLAEMAHELQPTLLAARLVLARSLAAQGNLKRLQKHLERSWQRAPHPALASCFLTHFCDAAAAKTHKQLERLLGTQADHIESHLLKAEVMLKLGEYDTARNTLKLALNKAESARVYRLFAELERKASNDEKQASHWLEMAIKAPKEVGWHCTHCGAEAEGWLSHCHSCGQFDVMAWTLPKSSAQATHLASA